MTESPPDRRSIAIANWLSNGPWRSRSVAFALLVTLVGVFFWISEVREGSSEEADSVTATNLAADAATQTNSRSPAQEWDWKKPLPAYAKLSASYIVGCFAGWFFRRLSRLVLVVVTVAISILAIGKFVGIETSAVQDEVNKGAEWTQSAIDTARSSMKFAVPSASGFGIGMFMGFRRRRLRG